MTSTLRRQRLVLAALTILGAVALFQPADSNAQTSEMRAAAIVNDQVISIFELSQRTRLAILAAGIEPSEEMRQRMARQILRALIDERLQLQEAARNNISVSQNDINEAVERVASQNSMNREQFMQIVARSGVAPSILEEQFRARIAWTELLQSKVYRQIDISEDEVDEVIGRIEANVGKPEYHVSEIYLDVGAPEQEDEVRLAGERMVQQIAQGASFSGLARQFSQSATAAVGGDMGWVQPGQLAPEMDAVLPTMRVGEVIGPIRTFGGFHVIALRDRRLVSLNQSGGSDRLTLKQIFLSLPKEPSEEQAKAVAEKVKAINEAVKSCDDLDEAAKTYGDAGSGDLGEVELDELPKPIAAAVSSLREGQISTPVRIGAGVTIVMVCERTQASQSVDRKAIERSLRQEQATLLARRYMRDLRRSAFVDVRL